MTADGPARGAWGDCNYVREVAMADGSRITVCDGPGGEMEQVQPDGAPCPDFEPVTGP